LKGGTVNENNGERMMDDMIWMEKRGLIWPFLKIEPIVISLTRSVARSLVRPVDGSLALARARSVLIVLAQHIYIYKRDPVCLSVCLFVGGLLMQ